MQHMQKQFATNKSTVYIELISQISTFNTDWLYQAFIFVIEEV